MSQPAIVWSDPQRERAFTAWLSGAAPHHGLRTGTLRPASNDTSHRRYFRIDAPDRYLVIMDAPPDHEDCRPFLRMAQLLGTAGLHVPKIFDWDEANGFMLLSDLGQTTYLDQMRAQPGATEALCRDASAALVRLQRIPAPPWIPEYDEARLTMELGLFSEWYVDGFFGMALDATAREGLQAAFQHLVRNALAQPRVLVHRDYHSRNLMAASPNPGILDFQGAVRGHASYDLVSLLRDAYIEWDLHFQREQARLHWERARCAGIPVPDGFDEFWRDFEWSGLQRQLKVLGFFARLSLRDDRHEYIADMPRVWGYAYRTARHYPEFRALAGLLERTEPSNAASSGVDRPAVAMDTTQQAEERWRDIRIPHTGVAQ